MAKAKQSILKDAESHSVNEYGLDSPKQLNLAFQSLYQVNILEAKKSSLGSHEKSKS